MTSPHRLSSIVQRSLVAPACLAALLVLPVHSQVAPAATVDAATLAKYDANKNGVLDADEQAVLDADRSKGVPVASEEVVSLSPFEVISDTKGYYASNTMSGTRFNTKLEDLASSITVVTKEQMSDF